MRVQSAILTAIVLAIGACGGVGGEQDRALAAEKASRPKGPPLSDAELKRFTDWRDANALPAVRLVPSGPAPATQGGSRIGGPVWLPQGEDWPKGSDGKELSFLAQIDFSDLPPLPDYPTSGVLQFFIGRDDLYGADLENPEQGQFKAIWRERVDSPGRLETRKFQGRSGIDDYSPLYEQTVRTGIALRGTAMVQMPDVSHWRFGSELGDLAQRDVTNRIFDLVDAELKQSPDSHHVGGHAGFTQSDYREKNHLADVDRVLLQLWSDDHIMWGDSGQGQFTIRRADLLKRDFSKVLYHWDCY